MGSSVRVRLVFVLLSLLPHVSRAQWTFLTTLPSGASTVYFLDKVGTPQVGFVGLTSGIMRTSDRGATWSPVIALGFNIRDFVFWDSLHGIAVCAGANAVFTTSDGGQSWTQNAYFGTRATSAIYLPRGHTLVINSLSAGGVNTAMFSIDSGQSWKQYWTLPVDMNGFAAYDSLHAIIA